ncbi:hypothetical protein GLAREA_11502 [Glarea lozoyensis ATCC 20868]|uniref:Uncharacterized protein n=1 Tax=Glarea lozoyensis (strain ATCC 20868 / MF5171) TaxID=1116229 RepID=S3CYL9_GLAL2|nr:uncharacterized protein GLAREA_11502 [Glarea lozoyensis ATCC 20868]EPE24921.1 hypothetical protein GLAREA_11502 [Glarea lozoyensis ATCC 20868]
MSRQLRSRTTPTSVPPPPPRKTASPKKTPVPKSPYPKPPQLPPSSSSSELSDLPEQPGSDDPSSSSSSNASSNGDESSDSNAESIPDLDHENLREVLRIVNKNFGVLDQRVGRLEVRLEERCDVLWERDSELWGRLKRVIRSLRGGADIPARGHREERIGRVVRGGVGNEARPFHVPGLRDRGEGIVIDLVEDEVPEEGDGRRVHPIEQAVRDAVATVGVVWFLWSLGTIVLVWWVATANVSKWDRIR